MKRLIALTLCLALLLASCEPGTMAPTAPDGQTAGLPEAPNNSADTAPTEAANEPVIPTPEDNFPGLNAAVLLRSVEDSVYANIIAELDSDLYFVENVSAIYISQEYIDELSYNSQANIYFGYTLSELEEQFQGAKFVFTLRDDGQTAVKEFEEYDDTYDRVIRNVAIGTGVILLCVTISVVTSGGAAPAICAIFAASAKTATIAAISGGLFSGVTAGIVTGIQTKDFNDSLKAAALAGSEAFKWGAITGAISGGATEAIALKGATLNGLTMNQAAVIQHESKLPL